MTMDPRVGKYTAAVLYFMCIGLCYPILASKPIEEKRGELGESANISCTVPPSTKNVQWLFQKEPITMNARIKEDTQEVTVEEKDLDGEKKKTKISTLTIANLTAEDAGNYTCLWKTAEEDPGYSKTFNLNLSFPVKLVANLTTQGPIKKNVTYNDNINLTCVFEVYKLSEVRWYKKDHGYLNETDTRRISLKRVQTDYTLTINQTEANGTYICEVFDNETSTNASGSIDVIVYAAPKILINEVIPISPTQLYVNWTVWTYNLPMTTLSLIIREPLSSVDNTPTMHREKISESNTSFVMNGLKKSTTYEVGILVITALGECKHTYKNVTTLDKEPTFVPQISINGFSATSVTIGWEAPSPDIEKFIHYYLLTARKKDQSNTLEQTFTLSDGRNLPYMFGSLEPHTTYVFKVRACSEYTNQCGNWSQEMEAATLDGKPGEPADVTSYCDVNFMNITWNEPHQPNAEIKGYIMELTGYAKYIDRHGYVKEDTWGPLSKFMTNTSRSVRFEDLQPNTLYVVRLSGMTRTRRRGSEAVLNCTTRPAPPDSPPRPRWRKILDIDKYRFKLYLPRVSERNGPICCYRVYMVHLPPNTQAPSPKDIKVLDYEKAHAFNGPAAYITDVFTNDNFPNESDLIMGDGRTVFNRTSKRLTTDECRICLERPRQLALTTTTTSTTTPEPSTTTEDEAYEDTTDDPLPRKRRYYENDFANDRMMMDTAVNIKENKDILQPVDGPLDPNSNYTLFVELIMNISEYESSYSSCLNPLMPAPNPAVAVPSTTLEIALQVTCAVAALVLVSMVVFCVVQTRRSRKMHHHHHGHEMSTLQTVFKYVTGRGKQQVVSAVPPDLPPIPKDDLADAYAERQVDSDYGFQKEFELLQMLPECYPDRTTHASEARENQPKNRYPDIKAYDQTRVKLSQIDGITGSDYINANYVRGYTDPKKFICAQGPTDTTVNDFWRMIWEHGLELIVMLTNLEEYSKVKCSKYWPDEVRGARAFGAITVHHVSEKRYSDYIVRELKITKQATNADGQPIVENNGIAKRNGDCKEPSESSEPTSPRELKEGSETRTVRQYHFLMWKDFAAPEHPYSILKFIKRVNEAQSSMSAAGRPVVVHCSAGVGRTGTLVALDCLLDQLAATGHAAVFNTVADLRRQRNFLVQSLKQYVFVYRALVEWAHYGDTEIPASRLKAQVDRLRNTPEGADKCLMEHQFDKILNSPVAEPLKSCAAGAGDELRSRNRSGECLPYDRNRVILTPIPARDYSTYINASFIEAYDNSEGFIITQDPLPNTIMDFWRMVAEHNVSTIVMLSELGDGKCPRYWEDNTAQYEHIGVQYEESESCPYYTRRQFRLTNIKSGEVVSVRQVQYQGWPTAPGHVPEVTRGLAELADAALPAHATPTPHPPHHGVMLVHCQFGTERSSLFVALCVLISQLRVERRVDVCCVARKVRSQRANTIDTFLQYEFLHRAILNYAELHNLLEDS